MEFCLDKNNNNIEILEQNFQSFITAGSYSYTIPKTGWYYILMSGGGGGGNSFLASGGNGGNATSKHIRDETTDGKMGNWAVAEVVEDKQTDLYLMV